jgi:hypothetical protein
MTPTLKPTYQPPLTICNHYEPSHLNYRLRLTVNRKESLPLYLFIYLFIYLKSIFLLFIIRIIVNRKRKFIGGLAFL